jgi:hypothetical protein
MFCSEWVFEFDRLHTTINTLSMYYVTYNWHDTFKVHIPNLLGSSCFSRHSSRQMLKMASSLCTHAHIHSRTVAPFRKFQGLCEWFEGHKKCVGEVCLYYQLDLNTLGILRAPTNKNTKSWCRTNVGALFRKPFAEIHWYQLFPPFWCGELTPEVCLSILDTPCITVPVHLWFALGECWYKMYKNIYNVWTSLLFKIGTGNCYGLGVLADWLLLATVWLEPGDRTQTSYSHIAWRDPRMGHEGPYLKNTYPTWHLPYTWK